VAPQNFGVLMQEHPVKFVERVARLMRIPALRHRRHLLPPPLAAQPFQCDDPLEDGSLEAGAASPLSTDVWSRCGGEGVSYPD
jgi:hypothetical protein